MMDLPLKVFLKKNPFFAIFLPLPTKTISPPFFLLFLRTYIISLQSNQTKETTFPFLFFFFFLFFLKLKTQIFKNLPLKKMAACMQRDLFQYCFFIHPSMRAASPLCPKIPFFEASSLTYIPPSKT